MSTTFRLNADELEPSFLEKLKAMFAHKYIRISVTPEESAPAFPKGVLGKDLLSVLDSLPKLSEENADAFSEDIREIRRMGNAPLPPDPWAS